MTKHPIEVITSVERRRRWSREDKEQLVAACFEPDAVISEIARAAGEPPPNIGPAEAGVFRLHSGRRAG
ncbi:transposase [Agrobacterium sp. NPDC058088]|uniref:transposase n=1 Tax=Agrobacterium sp. NPDC058088 TaxID=3346335 RepID=UPI0036DA65A9